MPKAIVDTSTFDHHRLVSFVSEPSVGLQGFIAVHRRVDNRPSFGATRLSFYNNTIEALQDALRLSKLMSYKAALAGLKYGGAKGVIIAPQHYYKKPALLKKYCDFINHLGGLFVTGADVGLNSTEVKFMKQHSRFIVGVKTDPVKYTALGIIKALEVCLDEIFGNHNFTERTFAIQGLGKIGEAVVKLLYKKAKKIFVADINPKQTRLVQKRFPKIFPVHSSEIYQQRVDVFMPCALGNVINMKTAAKIHAAIVLGGANNQLASSSSGEWLYKHGILYAPDYVVNSGGLMAVVDEYEHQNADDARIKKSLNHIAIQLRTILQNSKKTHKAPNLIADKMAANIFNKY